MCPILRMNPFASFGKMARALSIRMATRFCGRGSSLEMSMCFTSNSIRGRMLITPASQSPATSIPRLLALQATTNFDSVRSSAGNCKGHRVLSPKHNATGDLATMGMSGGETAPADIVSIHLLLSCGSVESMPRPLNPYP